MLFPVRLQPLLYVLPLCLSLSLACTADDTAEAGESEANGDGDGDSGGDGDNPATCPEAFESGDPNAELPPPFVSCALESPCDTVIVDLSATQTTGGDEDVQNLDALDCVLTSLDSGARASYAFTITSLDSSEALILSVYEGGHAELSRDRVEDSAYDTDRIPHNVDAAASFADCSGLLWSDVWSCVRDGLLECTSWASDAELCPG